LALAGLGSGEEWWWFGSFGEVGRAGAI